MNGISTKLNTKKETEQTLKSTKQSNARHSRNCWEQQYAPYLVRISVFVTLHVPEWKNVQNISRQMSNRYISPNE